MNLLRAKCIPFAFGITVWIFCREATHSTPMYETGLKLLSITVLLTVANFDGSSTTIWCEPGFCTCANTTTVAAVIISSRISTRRMRGAHRCLPSLGRGCLWRLGRPSCIIKGFDNHAVIAAGQRSRGNPSNNTEEDNGRNTESNHHVALIEEASSLIGGAVVLFIFRSVIAEGKFRAASSRP